MILRVLTSATVSLATALYLASCTPAEPSELDELGKVRLSIKDQVFELWIADDPGEVMRGLMYVTAEEMADLPDGAKRGMLFVFGSERHLNFWMKNTIIPLDVAYVDSHGRIVAIHTMIPLDTRTGQYPSGSPARYAIEVNANVFADLGVVAGDTIAIPFSALKGSP